MKKLIFSIAASVMALAATPANAVLLFNSSSLLPPTPFAAIQASQGTQLASNVFAGVADTFSAEVRQAVYLNSNGFLDFYYQILRTGVGSDPDPLAANQEIGGFTVSAFNGYTVLGFAAGGDPDGPGGVFVAANNPTLANGMPSPSTTTFGRSTSGNILRVNFGANGLTDMQNSATYVFRTNARQFNFRGNGGVIDGSTLDVTVFQPTGGPVPEPATWAMMVGGFGLLGAAARRSRRGRTVLA